MNDFFKDENSESDPVATLPVLDKEDAKKEGATDAEQKPKELNFSNLFSSTFGHIEKGQAEATKLDDKALEGKRESRFLTDVWVKRVLVTFAVLIIIAGSIMLAFFTYQKQSGKGPQPKLDRTLASGVLMIGNMQGMDFDKLTVGITWALSYQCVADDPTCPESFTLYASTSSSPIGSWNSTLKGVQQRVSTTLLLAAELTDASTSPEGDEGDPEDLPSSSSRPNTIYYPFDAYFADDSFYALGPDGRAIGFYDIFLTNTVQGFAATAYSGSDGTTVPPTRFFNISVRRATAVKGFAIVVAIIIWAISLICCFVTGMSVIGGYRLPPSFLAIPTTILFALPQVRSTMPGVPTFGTYLDMCSLLICEILVGACFLAMNIHNVRRSGINVDNLKGHIGNLQGAGTQLTGAVRKMGTTHGQVAGQSSGAEGGDLEKGIGGPEGTSGDHDGYYHDANEGDGFGQDGDDGFYDGDDGDHR